ncbi:hypothetical protein [[Kitasatospora] papulosa]|uniref:hypothetical protein n=1 Tax=[Kitasatospora] papulosa TaxID=1464011 RepID=UPI00363F7AC2
MSGAGEKERNPAYGVCGEADEQDRSGSQPAHHSAGDQGAHEAADPDPDRAQHQSETGVAVVEFGQQVVREVRRDDGLGVRVSS